MNPSIYTYFINSHGEIVTTLNPVAEVRKLIFFPIHIHENIEIMTYTSLGETNWQDCNTINFQCNKNKKLFLGVRTPIYKFKKRFPEVILAPDEPTSQDKKTPALNFYSGIVHCIPESREDSSKKKEIIHNMDADPLKDCSDDSIFPYYSKSLTPSVKRPYYSTNKYSKDYVEVLKTTGSKRKSPLDLINKCGPLLLSQAIAIIMFHCKTTYPHNFSNSIIQIHLTSCLKLSEDPIKYNAGMKTVSDFGYFTSESSNIDPKIKDTPHSRTYSYTADKKVFVINVPKPESYSYGVLDINQFKYRNALAGALQIILKSINLLPNEIIISIPEGRTMEEEDIQNYILNILNKLISDSKKSNKRRNDSPQSRKKAIKLDTLLDTIGLDPVELDEIEKELDEKETRLGDQAEKELYDLMQEATPSPMNKEKKSKKSKKSIKAQEMSSSNESTHSSKKHRETSKGGQKRFLRIMRRHRRTKKSRKKFTTRIMQTKKHRKS